MDFARLKGLLKRDGRSPEWLGAADAMAAAFEAACSRVNTKAWKPKAPEIVGMRGKILKASAQGIQFRGRGVSMQMPWRSLKAERRQRFLAGASERPDAGTCTARVAYALLAGLTEVADDEATEALRSGVELPDWLLGELKKTVKAATGGADKKEETKGSSAGAAPSHAVALRRAGAGAPGDWPHWRGPERDDVSSESSGFTGAAWPGEAVWSANVGEGASSPIVAGGRLYAMGWRGGTDTVSCLDAATGKDVWRKSYPCPKHGRHATGDKGRYSGPSSTPEYDPATGLLFTLSIDGHLHCWDAKTGGKRWAVNLYDAYRAPQRPNVGGGKRDYGYTTAPLAHGEWVVVEVGSPEGNLMAFDKKTGKRQWASQSKDAAGHTGGIAPITVGGVPCAAVLTLKNLVVVRLDGPNAGRTVAQYPWSTHYANNISAPAVHGSHVLVTSEYNQKAIVNLKITLGGATQVWKVRQASKVCTPVVHKGKVYWAWRRLRCLDFASGRLLWEGGDFSDPGSCIVTADGRIVVWGKRGTLVLAETAERSPGAYKELARKDGVGSGDAWPHVAFSQGRLYCRDRKGDIKCFRVAR
jgi:outer membrane protein assembly factor BamB